MLIHVVLHSNPTLTRPPILQWKSGLIRQVSSLKGDNIVIFYYLNVSAVTKDRDKWRQCLRALCATRHEEDRWDEVIHLRSSLISVGCGGRGLIRRGLLY